MLIRRKQHETPGLNTTSTADISFMLLIFFLVTTSMDVDSAGRIGLSESLRKQANLDREVTVVGNYDHLEVWDRAAADEDDDDEALLDLFFS